MKTKLSFKMEAGFCTIFSVKSPLLLKNMSKDEKDSLFLKLYYQTPKTFFFLLKSVYKKREKELSNLSHLKTHLLIPRIWFQLSSIHLKWLYGKPSLSTPVSYFQWLLHFASLIFFPAEYGRLKYNIGLFFK